MSGSSRLANAAELVIFPNPAEEQLQVELPEASAGDAHLVLSNAAGQEIRQAILKGGQAILDGRAIPTGTYLLRVELPNGARLGRVVQVQH